jgi:hypothetical protein
MKVDEANAEELLKFTQNSWGTEGWDQRVAEVSAKYLVSLRKLNAAAAWWLTASIGLEITGIAATAVTALLVVQHLS